MTKQSHIQNAFRFTRLFSRHVSSAFYSVFAARIATRRERLNQNRPGSDRRRWRSWHPIFSAFALIVLFVSMNSKASAEDVADLAEYAMDAVVTVLVLDKDNKVTGNGSGFYISPSLILTNNHVADGAALLAIRGKDGRVLRVERTQWSDPRLDYALLRVPKAAHSKKWLELADYLPRLGSTVMVIGAPKGLEFTVSVGNVTAIRNYDARWGEVIQMSAPISPGNSGSPVIDGNGKVVGVVIFFRTGGQLLNFAMPSTRIRNVLPASIVRRNRSKQTPDRWTLLRVGDSADRVEAVMGKRTTDYIEIPSSRWLWVYELNGGAAEVAIYFDDRKQVEEVVLRRPTSIIKINIQSLGGQSAHSLGAKHRRTEDAHARLRRLLDDLNRR